MTTPPQKEELPWWFYGVLLLGIGIVLGLAFLGAYSLAYPSN
jgi:hypothetical protein